MYTQISGPQDTELKLEADHPYQTMTPQEAAEAYVKTLIRAQLQSTPAWQPKGFAPAIVLEVKDGKRIHHPFVFDLTELMAS